MKGRRQSDGITKRGDKRQCERGKGGRRKQCRKKGRIKEDARMDRERKIIERRKKRR